MTTVSTAPGQKNHSQLPKRMRTHLSRQGFAYQDVRTTPNFTYEVVLEHPLEGEDATARETRAKDFGEALLKALEGMPEKFRVLNTYSIVEEAQNVAIDTVRIKRADRKADPDEDDEDFQED